jgi:phosphoribosylanthranilate isomerase
VFVKICGVRTEEDLHLCRRAGADAVGFNFWSGSSRYLPPGAAARLAPQPIEGLLRVGVFVNAPTDEIARVLDSGVIDLAQLHGDEPPEACAAFSGRAFPAVRLGSDASLKGLDRYPPGRLLIDAAGPAYGGSGLRLDLELAARAARRRPVILAGGLTPDNVAEAIARVRPVGVDVSSGVERSPGVKDPDRVLAFITAARSVPDE